VKGSFTCCKHTTQDPWLYFLSEKVVSRTFIVLTNPSTMAGYESVSLESNAKQIRKTAVTN
jgi:hypothetical protein